MNRSFHKRISADSAIFLAIAGVSILHYVAPVHAHHLHDIYRRLYYLPIIFAAFRHGFRGGAVAAAVVCAAYAPHAFGQISMDPASNTQKILEMFLYFAVGLTTGSLVSRLQRTQRQLQGSLEQLRSTEAQLVQAAKLAAVGRLSAGLAHEIRNPLASIKGSAEILADDFPKKHPKHRLLEVLIEESGRLNHVLTRFLAFARPRPLEQKEFDIMGEIESAIALLQSGPQNGPAVRFVVDGRLNGPIMVRGDREQLRQVLLNILLNARQASGEGGEVRVRCEVHNRSLHWIVQDAGSGFSQEAIDNAFTPFFTTKQQGTGLGLAISHKIIESHGGSITVGNGKAGGAVVEVEIPIQEEHAQNPFNR